MSDLSPVILLDAIREQKLIRQAEESLADFAIQAWNVLEPATELKWGWALEAICEHLEAVTNGNIYRLVMNVPPGPMRDDSIVETSRGPVLLRDVVVGDLVLTHLGRYRPVSAVHHQGVLPILKITTNSGRETFAAPSHPYLTPKGWVDAGDLVIGDLLAIVNRREDRPDTIPLSAETARFLGHIVGDAIISIEPQLPANCMCLTVEEDHSFTCSGIAVKNSMKSLLTGVIWPAWEWGPRNLPSTRYLSTAHKQDLAVRDNMKCRRLIQSEWYQSRWPIKLTGDQNSKLKFENSSTGFREAMAFTSMTGSRGDRVILDDPLSVDDARSDAALDAAESTFREALPTRVNNDKSAIVVIMQRLHERDTTGIILKEKLGYEHLCLPMRFEPDRRCRTSIGFVDPRTKSGELMFPERFSEAQVTSLEKTMGEYASAGQLQQRPSPAGGGIIKIDHFQLWPNNKPLPVIDFVVQSVDPAYTEKTTNDPTAFCAWGVFTDGDKRGALLLDCWSDHLAFPQLREKLISEWHSLYGKTDTRTGKKPDVLLIEAKASGLSIIQDLRQANLPAIPYNPGNADKTNRAHQVTPILELDCLYIPESNKEPTKFVTWARPFLSQLEKFPNAEHDDFVDCFTQCIIYLRDLGKFELNFAEFDPIEDEDYYDKKKRRVNPYSQ